METVNIYEAKTTLSKLISRVERGEQITISRNGRPVALLTAITRPDVARRPGALAGKIRIADDFDDLRGTEESDWYAG